MKTKSVTKNAILNVIKQVCMIIFPMISFPYASRILGVENFGKFNFGLSVVSYISIIAALGVNNYAIREGSRIKDDLKKLNTLVNEIFTLNIISTIVAYIILFLLLIFWKRLDSYITLILVQSIVVIFTTIGVDWLNSIYEDYFYLTIRYIVCQLISLLAMLLFVKGSQDYIIYAFVNASALILANFSNLIYVNRRYHIKLKMTPFHHIFRHLKPVIVMFGSALATVIYINSDTLILGIMKSNVEVGYYSVSVKVYSLVKQVINAVMVVMIPRISYELSKNNHDIIHKRLEALQNFIVLVTIPIIAGLFYLSPQIIELFAGKSYMPATSSLQIISISLLFAVFANYFVNVILIPYKREKYFLIGTFISATLNILLNFVLIPKWGINAAAFTTVLSELVLSLIAAYYSRDIVKLKWSKELAYGIFTAVTIMVVNQLVNQFTKNGFIVIITTMVVSIFFFILLLLLLYKDQFENSKKIKNK
ncbi:flippase [Streptococcus hyovaginalis]